jgi:RNA polymerase sigma factor (sigma-70 family)
MRVGDFPRVPGKTRRRCKTCVLVCKGFVRGVARDRRFDDRTTMAVSEASHAPARTLEGLYRRHGAEVYHYALAVLGNHADAEDVTQTTFLNAYRALEQGVHPRKPTNWLLTIASNAIKQRFRQEQSRPRQVELERDVPASNPDSEGPTVGELLTALSKIPPQQRQAIVLREFEGRSYKEIAEIIGVTTTALETLLFRARRSLTEELAHQLTCTEAQQAVSREADGRLGRKERRRLREHVAECPDCARFSSLQQRNRTAFRGLALVPIPVSLTLFKGFEGSAAAATLGAGATGASAVGVGAGATAAGTGGAAVGGGSVFAGGLAVKAAAVAAAASVAGGVTVAKVDEIGPFKQKHSPVPAHSKTKAKQQGTGGIIHSQRAEHASAQGLEHGKAVARGQTGTTPPRHVRREQNAAETKTTGKSAIAGSNAHKQSAAPKKTAVLKEPRSPRGKALGQAKSPPAATSPQESATPEDTAPIEEQSAPSEPAPDNGNVNGNGPKSGSNGAAHAP